jgi:hypothetical protein
MPSLQHQNFHNMEMATNSALSQLPTGVEHGESSGKYYAPFEYIPLDPTKGEIRLISLLPREFCRSSGRETS